MTDALLDAVRRLAGVEADADGIARTAVPGMTLVRTVATGPLQHAISRPLICLVVQGAKEVTTGHRTLVFDAGSSMLVTADVPTVTRITRATPVAPYLSFALHLDPALVTELSAEIGAVPVEAGAPLRFQPTDAEVADAALRLLRLLDRPASVPVLGAQLVRELHYWLLAGRHGPAIRRLAVPDSPARRIARAVGVIRSGYASPLPVGRLAAVAGMSPSSFHQHFRAVTSLSPLQFQKRLRLIEARRLMLANGSAAREAAFAVGYESVPQFTREYRRFFGLPPVREIGEVRSRMRAAA